MTLGLLSEYESSIFTIFVSQVSYDTSSIFNSGNIPPCPIPDAPGPDCPELGPTPTAPPPAPLDAADVPEDVEEEDELELHVPNPVKCFVQTTKSEPTLILHSFAPEGTPETLSEVQVAVISVTVFVLWKKPTCVPVCPANKRRTGWLNVSDSDEPTVITSCGAATCPAATGKFRLSEL